MEQLKTTENQLAEVTEVKLIMPNTEELGKLEGMQTHFNLNPAYRTQEEWQDLKDQPIRCFYLGIREIPNPDGESINCAVFATSKEIFLAAQYVLVESVRQLDDKTPVEITYLGKKRNKSGEGSTNLFNVVTLI